ncbi:hypothetical protein A0H81_12138 [Grifola frondosa]|uniref:Uncharacterized protein n=1 Tax=Grifola frondosa TaxID=5627 RepID=A0A1C7LUX9_GRIFR|nr:hypothetical protein A0H81_12138 [Grifola frondosa]
MTEYATDPEAIQDYLNSRDPSFLAVCSPSLISDEDTPGYGPSDDDASSTHSLPPRMVLRYDDGRPDIPISRDRTVNGSSSRSRSTSTPQSGPGPQPAYHNRTNSASQINSFPINVPHIPSQARHAQSLSYATAAPCIPLRRVLQRVSGSYHPVRRTTRLTLPFVQQPVLRISRELLQRQELSCLLRFPMPEMPRHRTMLTTSAERYRSAFTTARFQSADRALSVPATFYTSRWHKVLRTTNNSI